MKLEDQVCSLELAKCLKAVGIKQDSLVYWMQIPHLMKHEQLENGDTKISILEYCIELGSPLAYNVPKEDTWSAFFVSELSELIFQKNYDYLEEMGYLNITIEMIDRSGGYFYRITNNLRENIIDDLNLANALATLFLHLFENKLELQNET
jgi:hypothetical protein